MVFNVLERREPQLASMLGDPSMKMLVREV
jgi:hypothetical protein